MNYHNYINEFKEQVVKDYLWGKVVKELSRKYCFERGRIRLWAK